MYVFNLCRQPWKDRGGGVVSDLSASKREAEAERYYFSALCAAISLLDNNSRELFLDKIAGILTAVATPPHHEDPNQKRDDEITNDDEDEEVPTKRRVDVFSIRSLYQERPDAMESWPAWLVQKLPSKET